MIVGFSKYGTGGGEGPTKYVIDEELEGREKAPPAVLRGDAEQTRNLIDSLEFKHKYTSGVLSFAPGEVITQKMETSIMDEFESLAFAGLEPDQYNILWVRHSHAGHHEIHFVTPRVELSTGKSLNIRPPGDLNKEHFDDFRSEINARYGLADPADPERAKIVSTPNHELKAISKAIRAGEKPPDNIRELITKALLQRVVQGFIRNREDLLENVKDFGLSVTREGKDYITVSEPQSDHRWRLKGAIYARDFEPGRTIEKTDAARERDYSRPDPRAAQRYAKRVERHISARAKYHQSRYPKPEPKHRLAHVQEQALVADANRLESLSRHIWRELGNDSLLHQPNNGVTVQRPDIETGRGQNSVQPVRSTEPALRPGRRDSPNIRGRLQDSKGILNERARNPLIERLEAFGAAIQRATASLRAGAKRLTDNVRTYLTRERELTSPSLQLKRSASAIEQAIQHEQKIDRQRQPTINR